MKKILVVDDDPDILEAIQLILISQGYDCQVSPKGNETYQKVAEYKPDLIILDVLLSGNDGRKICQILKGYPQTQQIPIIMISAHPSAKNTVKECGANSFVPKPFTIHQLTTTIQKMLK